MTASVPSRAPRTPPETGESTSWMLRSASPAATRAVVAGPVVERSTSALTRSPSRMPSAPSATCCTISGVGRLISTVSTASATAAAEGATVAPRPASGVSAAGLLS